MRTIDNLQVGFKWIAMTMDEAGPARFVFGCEESHGYLAGDHVRDKDAAVASMLMAELAASVKPNGQTLNAKLDALYWQFGYHAERQTSFTMPGSQGMKDMQALMARFRTDPPTELAGMKVTQVRDYASLTVRQPGAGSTPFEGPRGDMVILDLNVEGNYVAIRPSGTEPKVKLYLFAYEPAELIGDLEETKKQIGERLDKMQHALSVAMNPS